MGYIHAELMAQYAEDAKQHDKPWELWQYSSDGVWMDCAIHPSWYDNRSYRRKDEVQRLREKLAETKEQSEMRWAVYVRESNLRREVEAERDTLRAELAAINGQEPFLWFRSLIGAQCKPDGRYYDVVFSPCEGYIPLYAAPVAAQAQEVAPAAQKAK